MVNIMINFCNFQVEPNQEKRENIHQSWLFISILKVSYKTDSTTYLSNGIADIYSYFSGGKSGHIVGREG